MNLWIGAIVGRNLIGNERRRIWEQIKNGLRLL